jgi:hypothetical protein
MPVIAPEAAEGCRPLAQRASNVDNGSRVDQTADDRHYGVSGQLRLAGMSPEEGLVVGHLTRSIWMAV